jgi:hypothetical protein
MMSQSSDTPLSRVVPVILLYAGYAYFVFWILFMFRTILMPDYFGH